MESLTPKDPLENYHPQLFPRLQRISSAVLHFFTDRHTIPYSEAIPQRGGGAMLDSELYDQVQIHGFRYEGEVATLETPVPFSR